MNSLGELELTLEDHRRAFTEVSFLLEILVRTASEAVGRSMPSLATSAGRQMGRKLPGAAGPVDFGKVLPMIGESLSGGFEIAGQLGADGAELHIEKCVVRDVCRQQGLELGGELCKAFHCYLAGMMAHLVGKQVRQTLLSANETCELRVDVQR
ncbi:MAG TPA: L-2-amino-thiazoline-4-carboxylic acid hydrolase [Anaeromyxobacteraceae bacterium]|nr:L-2-amino-thiazoline-4-carboxylic acid hydrolase [Anaeromyxobacteraceae bacterium]